MKRSKGLKRDKSKGLKRTELGRGDKPLKPGDKPLSVDRGKVREFKQRAAENSNRRDPLPADVRERVYERYEGRCVMCGSASWIDPHHILPVQRWPELELEEFNIITLCRGCHDAHERHSKKVPLKKLPKEFEVFLLDRPDRQDWMERHYAA